VKETFEQDLAKYQEMYRITARNLDRLEATIIYIQEKLKALETEDKENQDE
jgi:hypothetical protein